MRSKKGWNKYSSVVSGKSVPAYYFWKEASLQGVLRNSACGDHLWSPRDHQCPNAAGAGSQAPCCPVYLLSHQGKEMKSQWRERLKRYHWLPERLKEGPRDKGPSKDGKPSEAWLDAYTSFVEKQQLCFLARHHGMIFGLSPWIWWTGGHQPLVGVKGTRQEWSNSKASWLNALAEGDGRINKIIQDHIHGDHAASGRRNIKLNCRDADARVGWGHLMSPEFPSWMLTSQSGEKHPN